MTSPRLGIALALWSAGFAAVHAAWALGWRGGVPAQTAPIGERPVFLAYVVLTGALLVLAAYVAVRLGRGGLVRRARRRLSAATLVGSLLALGRGVPALAIDAATGLTGDDLTTVGVLADLWFVVAGAGGLALWSRTQAETADWAGPGPTAGSGQASFSRKNDRTRSTPSC